MSPRLRRRFVILAAAAAVVGTAMRRSPRPRVLAVRFLMDLGGRKAARALSAHVPDGVAARRDLAYDPADRDGRLDVFHPAAIRFDTVLPTIVWIHGGAWVSGSKDHVADYLRILAAEGFTTIGVEYTQAPEATYPTPVVQIGRALAWISAHAEELHVDPDRLVLAGDSAGAQLAAQVATIVTNPAYAARIGVDPPALSSPPRGVILFCGAFDFAGFDPRSPLRRAIRDVLWAYGGSRDAVADGPLGAASIGPDLTGSFPRTFISVGDADPLAPQSVALADRLASLGVGVDRLFFEGSDAVGLGHEYQFDLDRPAGRLGLERAVVFARDVTGGA